MKLALPHWALIALSLASSVFAWLQLQVASGAITLPQVVLTALPLVGGILGLLSPSAVPSSNVAAALKSAAVKAAVSALALVLFVGCAQVQAVFPTLQAIEQVVAADLAAGKTDAQMASDVCAALGGTQSTDAICADAAIVLQDVVTVLLDSGVLAGPALDNAHAFQARAAARAGK